MKLNNCKVCNKEFTYKKNLRSYCSADCYKKYRKAYFKEFNKREHRREYFKKLKKTLKWRTKLRLYKKKYLSENESARIAHNLRTRMKAILKKNKTGKSNSSQKLTGCSFKELKVYLQNKFQKGMSWNNYGDWHIDHIIPCSAFDLTKEEHQIKCFHYTNLQPLWAYDNKRKSNKF